MINNHKKVLILAPHTDDGELGCGGTMAQLIERGSEISYVAFSSSDKSLPKTISKNTLKEEVKKAMKILCVAPKNLILFNYDARNFLNSRQAILEDMIRINERIKPNLVFLPTTYDTHQDHQTISQEGFRAFKKVSILGYELPWNNTTFNTQGFVVLRKHQLAKKIAALSCYKSQAKRLYMSKNFIESLAKTRGIQIGAQYAESFEVIRWILL